MSLARVFLALRDQPVQLHLDRTLMQYTPAGPVKGPIVFAGKAGRVLHGRLDVPPGEATLYLDFEVTNVSVQPPGTALLDITGTVEEPRHGCVPIRSRTAKGEGIRFWLEPDDIAFFACPELADVSEWTGDTIPEGGLVFELTALAGSTKRLYIPASWALTIIEETRIALV